MPLVPNALAQWHFGAMRDLYAARSQRARHFHAMRDLDALDALSPIYKTPDGGSASIAAEAKRADDE